MFKLTAKIGSAVALALGFAFFCPSIATAQMAPPMDMS